ncbi:MAG: pantetheine-phosphate adenylyltransferase [Actinomycetes bacterium]|jgi:pantetheine-phosphate adenylyltransferase
MRKAVCPGSFDPVTNGHLDIISRASALFDHVTVGVLVNQSKAGLFSVEERMKMLNTITEPFENVSVESFSGLLVDFCKDHEISAIVKGLRAVTDFDYELQMSQMNHRLTGIETLFVSTNPIYGYLSSSLVKEIAGHGGDVSGLVPDSVLQQLTDRLAT